MRRTLSALAIWIVFSPAAWAERVEGRVVDESGEGVSGVEVAAAWVSDSKGLRPVSDAKSLLSVTTDRGGLFSVYADYPVDSYGVLALTKDRTRGAVASSDFASRARGWEIRLVPTVLVTGSLHLRGAGAYPEGGFLWVAPLPRSPCLVRVEPSQGKFEVPLPLGRYVLVSQAPGRGRETQTLEVVPTRGPLALGPIALATEASTVRIGDIPPPIEFEPGSTLLLEDRLCGRHFPAGWTLLYFWDHT